MVDLSVKLISPCIASDKWSNGYRVHAERNFTSASHLKAVLEEIMEAHMPSSIQPLTTIKFRQDLKYENLPDGFQVSSPYKTFRVRNSMYGNDLGEIINSGNQAIENIVETLNALGVPQEETVKSLNNIFQLGLLDDEPNNN